MRRVHPKELLEVSPEEASALMDVDQDYHEDKERKLVTTFSWKMAISCFEKKMKSRCGRPAIYYLDGRLIKDELYRQSVTEEICQEYGLDLLDLIADLILPVGFSYPSLLGSLPSIVDDAFKPVSMLGQEKVVVWVEDHQWTNTTECSILEPFLQTLLLADTEPYLIAPAKYFDQEVMCALANRLFKSPQPPNSIDNADCKGKTNPESEKTTPRSNSKMLWETFDTFLKIGFILALRAFLPCPIIILHIGLRLSDRLNAHQLLDLAEAEGHKVMYLKNTATSLCEQKKIIDKFVKFMPAKFSVVQAIEYLPHTEEDTDGLNSFKEEAAAFQNRNM